MVATHYLPEDHLDRAEEHLAHLIDGDLLLASSAHLRLVLAQNLLASMGSRESLRPWAVIGRAVGGSLGALIGDALAVVAREPSRRDVRNHCRNSHDAL